VVPTTRPGLAIGCGKQGVDFVPTQIADLPPFEFSWPAAVHDVKAAIRQVDLAACRKLASAALELASPREVRDLVSASKK
jgi:hypothetical protein